MEREKGQASSQGGWSSSPSRPGEKTTPDTGLDQPMDGLSLGGTAESAHNLRLLSLGMLPLHQ